MTVALENAREAAYNKLSKLTPKGEQTSHAHTTSPYTHGQAKVFYQIPDNQPCNGKLNTRDPKTFCKYAIRCSIQPSKIGVIHWQCLCGESAWVKR